MPDALDQLSPTGDALDSLSPSPTPDNRWSRIGQGVVEALGLPTRIGSVEENLQAANPINWIRGTWDTMKEQYAKMKDAAGRGDYVTAAMHAAANAWPPLAPTANAQDKIVSGDVAGGLTQGIVNAVPQMLGFRPAARAAGVTKITPTEEAPLAKLPLSNEEAASATGVKKLQELRAAKPEKVATSAPTAIPSLKQYEPWVGPLDINKNVNQAQQMAEDHLNAKFDTYYNRAKNLKITADGNTVADAKMAGVNPYLDKSSPEYTNAVTEADSFRRAMPLDEVRDRLQILNQKLTPYYKASDDVRYQMEVANPRIADMQAEAGGLRDALYKAVDPVNDGENAATIRGRMADLVNFRQFTEAVQNKIAGTPPPNILIRALNLGIGGAETGFGAARMIAGEPSGVFGLQYGANRLISGLRRDPLAGKFNAVLRNWEGPKLTHIPDAEEAPAPTVPPNKIKLPETPDMYLPDPLGMRHLPPTLPNPFDASDVLGKYGPRAQHPIAPEDVGPDPLGMKRIYKWHEVLAPEQNLGEAPQQ